MVTSSANIAHGNRPAAVRMKGIFDLLKSGSLPNCGTLAQALGVSRKTIQRDLVVMRDQLGLPIEYSPTEHGYILTTHEIHEFPAVQVTQGELLALMVAQKAIEQYRGTPYYHQLETAFAKVLAPLNEMAGYAPDDGMVSFKIAAPAIHELDTFDRLSRAIGDCREVRFDYRKPGTTEAARRRVQPLHLTHRDGRWYLIGHDIRRQAKRTFALSRIRNVVGSRKLFKRPQDFSVERYFAAALGVMNGTEQHQVKIRFDPYSADHVRDRLWHESQVIKELPDGGLEMSLQLADLLEVQRLILQWGGLAVAIEPPELRQRIAKAARALLDAHEA